MTTYQAPVHQSKASLSGLSVNSDRAGYGRFSARELRSLLLSTVAASALIIASPRLAYAGPDGCTVSGTTVTCSGDQSAGIESGTDFTAVPDGTLIVNGLTGAITTSAGSGHGIEFNLVGTNGDVTINADTGPFGISTTGTSAYGIYGAGGNTGNVTITNSGIISTTGISAKGILGSVGNIGNVIITNSGAISTEEFIADSIYGRVSLDGNVTITNSGDLSTEGNTGARGIFARINRDGDISISNEGDITTAGTSSEGILGYVLNDGNVTITNSGDVSTEGNSADGINGSVVGNGNVAITNSGTISTEGLNAEGIYSRVAGDGNITITNSGTISTEGLNAEGIEGRVNGNGNVAITNSGTISTKGDNAFGISGSISGDGNMTITNSGDISTEGLDSHGIRSYINNYGDITITNSGDISTIGDSAVGIWGRVNNDGDITITTQGDVTSVQGDGILALVNGIGDLTVTILAGSTVKGGDEGVEFGSGTTSRLTNFGTIIGGDNGVEAVALTSLTNAGKITGGTNAILETGAGDTLLTLLPGSDIFGAIDLGGGTNTLNVGKGLSIDHVFATLPQTITTNGTPFVVDGTRVVVVDTTMLAQQDEVLFDITQGIWGTVFNNIGDGRNPGGMAFSGSQYSLGAVAPQNGNSVDTTKSHMWANMFGNRRRQDGDSPATSTRHDLFGFIGGIDGRVNSQVRLGGFFGFSETEIDTAANQQEADIDSYFGGLYASLKMDGLTFDLGFTSGATEYDSTRQVDNNQVNGLQTVSNSFDGTFIAPELSVSTRTDFAGLTLQPTFRAGYSGLFLDGYTETGSTAPLTVSDRNIHILHARFEMALLMSSKGPDSLGFYFSPYVGVDGRSLVDGKSIDVTLLGQNLSFDPGGSDDIASIFTGFRLNVAKTENFSFFAGVEGSLDTEESSTITGNLGLKWKF